MSVVLPLLDSLGLGTGVPEGATAAKRERHPTPQTQSTDKKALKRTRKEALQNKWRAFAEGNQGAIARDNGIGGESRPADRGWRDELRQLQERVTTSK